MPNILAILPIIFYSILVVVHIACFFAVMTYADEYLGKTEQQLILFGKILWGIVTLIGGIPVAIGFWVLHFSMLNPIVYLHAKRNS